MQELNFPKYSFNIKRVENQLLILDEVRKKWIVLTPEEWVRQHTVRYLIDDKNYPKGLLAIEKTIKVNNLIKRFDVLCYNTALKPILLVECKAPEIPITDKTMQQALRYNSVIQASLIVLTNGLQTICAKIDFEQKKVTYLTEIEPYKIVENA